MIEMELFNVRLVAHYGLNSDIACVSATVRGAPARLRRLEESDN
jgi:hypothetical protein